MYIFSYHQWNDGICYRQWYDDISLFYLQWNVGSSPSVERWCILLFSSLMACRCVFIHIISGNMVYVIVSGTTIYLFSIFSGMLVAHLQWNVGVSCYLHHQ